LGHLDIEEVSLYETHFLEVIERPKEGLTGGGGAKVSIAGIQPDLLSDRFDRSADDSRVVIGGARLERRLEGTLHPLDVFHRGSSTALGRCWFSHAPVSLSRVDVVIRRTVVLRRSAATMCI
jgi:hypothetical protein